MSNPELFYIIAELICFIVCLFTDPIRDKAVIDNETIAESASPSSSNTVSKSNRTWHIFNAASFTLLQTPFLVLFLLCEEYSFTKCIVVFVSLLMIRFTFFPVSLNKLRHEPLFYVSDKGLDKFFKNLLGSKSGLIKFLSGIIILVALNIVFVKFI